MFEDVLDHLGIHAVNSGVFGSGWNNSPAGAALASVNPATGKPIAKVVCASVEDYDRVVEASREAFLRWRMVPPPVRGEFVRQVGQALRDKKRDLGMLVTLETGKILSEGEGEVQEMIDMADFAVGLSRQLYGLTIASERPMHRMIEQWHPLGPIGVITAFNFPVAVWAWNAMIAAVCGDTVIWKPSPETPLTAVAVQHIVNDVAARNGCEGVFSLCVGGAEDVGERMIHDARLPLISATGSCRMGARVGEVVGKRLGRALLELGGNNALILTPSADFDVALRAVVFAAAGTAGQRCTTLRRLIVHSSVVDRFVPRLVNAYRSLAIGNPWEAGVLVGPLINQRAVQAMERALSRGEGARRGAFFTEVAGSIGRGSSWSRRSSKCRAAIGRSFARRRSRRFFM